MFGHDFYHSTIKKHTALMGTLFNDLVVKRESSPGVVAQQIKVPILYGPREKYLARIEADPAAQQNTAIKMPIISFELKDIDYDSERKLATLGRMYSNSGTANNTYYNGMYNPVPYNLHYQVVIYTGNVEDGTRILEQILPFFTPSWNATLKLIDDMPGITTDVYIGLDSVSSEDRYDGTFENRRAVTWTLDLTVKTFLYGPTTTTKIIKIADVEIYAANTGTVPDVIIEVYPGLTSNGEPTSNASLAIDPLLVEEDDDYGYVITYEEQP